MFKWLINKTQAAYDYGYWTSNSVGVFVTILLSLVGWFVGIYLSFRPVNVIDSCEEFLSSFLVDVGPEADGDQVSQLLH